MREITDKQELANLYNDSAYWDMYCQSVNELGEWVELYDTGERTVELFYSPGAKLPHKANIYD